MVIIPVSHICLHEGRREVPLDCYIRAEVLGRLIAFSSQLLGLQHVFMLVSFLSQKATYFQIYSFFSSSLKSNIENGLSDMYDIYNISSMISWYFLAIIFHYFCIDTDKALYALPQHVKDSTSCQAFKKCLKTHIFRLAH